MRKLLIMLLTATYAISGFGGDTDIAARSAADFGESVAVLSILAYDGVAETKNLIQSYGHAFLMLENTSNTDIMLNTVKVAPGESITFGWWAVDVHMGLWFNIESSYIELYNRYDTRLSTSVNIDSQSINAISDYMSAHDEYALLSNCAENAVNCWNLAVPDENQIPDKCSTPKAVHDYIMTLSEYEFAKAVPFTENIFYLIDGEPVTYKMEAPNA